MSGNPINQAGEVMNRSKPTKATAVIHRQADYVERSGVTVTITRGFETVAIEARDGQSVFMQDQEAGEFIAELDAMCKRWRSLDEDTAALALAKPYVDCCLT